MQILPLLFECTFDFKRKKSSISTRVVGSLLFSLSCFLVDSFVFLESYLEENEVNRTKGATLGQAKGATTSTHDINEPKVPSLTGGIPAK